MWVMAAFALYHSPAQGWSLAHSYRSDKLYLIYVGLVRSDVLLSVGSKYLTDRIALFRYRISM